MDSIIYTNSGAPLITPWSARGMSNEKYAALQVKEAKKHEVEADAAKVFDQPSMKVDDKQRNFLRTKIENIVKRLKILQKLFSGDGREMARALTQIFKELKAALKAYKELAGKELGNVEGMVGQAMAPAPAAKGEGDDAGKAEAKNAEETAPETAEAAPVDEATGTAAEAAPETAPEATTTDETSADGSTSQEASVIPEPPLHTPPPVSEGPPALPAGSAWSDKSSLYKAVEQKVRETIGNDAMDFLKMVKAVVKHIEEKMLSKARIQISMMKPDKDLEKVVKELNESQKDLHKTMDDMDRDLKAAVPTLGTGMHVDIAA